MARPVRARVVVIGAGIAGLLCARKLAAAGADVVVVDKGRGVGGRMATRRFGGAVFDHGAQFFTARPPWFDAEVRGWAAVGVVGQWFDGADPAWRGVPSMTAVAKYLAGGLEVHVATTVTSVSSGDSAPWRVAARVAHGRGDQGDDAVEVVMEADAVVITAPVPQALVMLAAGGVNLDPRVASGLQAVAYDPCLAVLAVLDGPSGMEPPGWQRGSASDGPGDAVGHDGGIVAWVADNHLKGVSAVPALTLHCTTSASVAMFDDDADRVISTVMAAAVAMPGHPGQGCGVLASQLVRWRYARVVAPYPEQFLFTNVAGVGPLVIAGDGFGGPRVESAAVSGTAAANALVDYWADRVTQGR